MLVKVNVSKNREIIDDPLSMFKKTMKDVLTIIMYPASLVEINNFADASSFKYVSKKYIDGREYVVLSHPKVDDYLPKNSELRKLVNRENKNLELVCPVINLHGVKVFTIPSNIPYNIFG